MTTSTQVLRPRVMWVVLVAVLVAIGTAEPTAQSSALPSALQNAMRLKLVNTQAMLEAVIRGDYPAIARAAEPLGRITETEVASWQTVAAPAYVEQAAQLLLAVKGLRDAAANANGNAVAVEYINLVSSCAKCHAWVRETRRRPSQLPVER